MHVQNVVVTCNVFLVIYHRLGQLNLYLALVLGRTNYDLEIDGYADRKTAH